MPPQTLPPLDQALDQLREIRERVVERQRFKGYSGRARALSGGAALAAAAVMSAGFYPKTNGAHLAGWAAVFVAAIAMNFGAMFHWFLYDPAVKRDWRRLKPALDPLPALAVGGALTFALIQAGQHRLLFGAWMCLFGLANLASRQALPRAIWPLGLFYIVCGFCALLLRGVGFLDPWPMGVVFLIGELAGGVIVLRAREPGASPLSLIGRAKGGGE